MCPPCRARKAAIAKTLGPKGLRHKWLRLDAEGDTLVLTTNKSSLTARLGVQVLPCGSAVLQRRVGSMVPTEPLLSVGE